MAKQTEEFLQGTCVFCQPWWLEAVAPGSWDVVVVNRGNAVCGAFPHVIKRRLKKFILLEMPPLTPYLGPWIAPSRQKPGERLGEEKDIVSELISKLPPYSSFHQSFHPSVVNWLPFYWNGFQQTTRYTYCIEPLETPDKCWANARDKVKTQIRRARERVEVIESEDVGRLYGLVEATFRRQKLSPPFSLDLLKRLDLNCSEKGVRKSLLAVDAQGRVHAGIYLVWDNSTVYYLLSGADPQLRGSGATSLLLWSGIEFALSTGRRFDFEGSMVESIERFVRSFGARQVPYFEIWKTNSFVVRSYRSLWRMLHST